MAGLAIASRGDGIHLIDLGGGEGAVLHIDTEPPKLWPSRSIAAIAKFGYWEDLPEDFDQSVILAAVASAVRVGS